MFTPQVIEEAILNLNNSNISVVQQANDTINKWKQTSNSIREAIEIISNSPNETVIFSVCQIAKYNILHNWMKYQPEERVMIRNKIATALVGFTGNDITRSKLIELIVFIALKEWPEFWPSCVQDFINRAADSQEMCILDMRILAELIVTIHDTDTIPNTRRQQLIGEFDKYSLQIMQMIVWSLENVGFDNICFTVIKLLKELCLTAPYSVLQQFIPDMFPSLFNSFAADPRCTDDAILTIENLLLNRSDAKEVASGLFMETLQILANICNGQPPGFILIFIMKYLSTYGPDIDELCFEGEDIIEENAQLVHTIYGAIINNPPLDEHIEEFWVLWRSVLYRYRRSTTSKNPFEILKPCFQLFQPLLPSIRFSLFQAFASAAEGGKLKSVNSQASWIFMASTDKKGMVEFLKEQPPSPSLCYAIGLVDACLSSREEREMVVGIFPTLFAHNQQTRDVEFGVALLYALSHAIRFLSKEISFLLAFGHCLLNFLQSEDFFIKKAAVNALFYISMRLPSLLLREKKHSEDDNEINEKFFINTDEGEGSIIYSVFGLLENISAWETKTAIKLLKSIALVASSRPDQSERQKIYEKVTEALSSLINSGNMEIIDNGLTIINALTTLKLNDGSMIFVPLFGEMVNILSLSTSAHNETKTSEIIETITSSLLFDINPIVVQNVQNFSGILLSLAEFRDSALVSFARLRTKYDLLEHIFDQIYGALVGDVINQLTMTKDDAFSVLRFLRMFNLRKKLIPLLLNIVVFFVKDERMNVAKESLTLLRKIIEFLCEDQKDEQHEDGDEKVNLFIIVEQSMRMNLIRATFSALTDTLHKEIFNQIAKTIQALYRAMSIVSMQISPEQFDHDFTTILQSILMDSTNGAEFYINFSRALRGHANDFALFSNDLKEFLVTTNCASPSDRNLFRNELKLDSLEEELMNLVASEEKNAIVAEELEILPALRDFKL